MIDRDHKLPLARQAKAVGISRGSIYYRPRPVGEAGLGLMRRIDELHLEYPFAGSRMMRGLLRQEGLPSGRRHIATLMRRMGIDALYRKPNTSRRRPGHTVYPYLLRGLEVSRPNQGGYVNRCVNDIRRRPSQPLIQWRFHPHTVHRGRRLRSTQGPSDA